MRGFGRTLALRYRLLFYGRDHCLTVTLEVPVRVEVRREDPSQVRGPRLLLPAEKSNVQGASACMVTSEQRHRPTGFQHRLEETLSSWVGEYTGQSAC